MVRICLFALVALAEAGLSGAWGQAVLTEVQLTEGYALVDRNPEQAAEFALSVGVTPYDFGLQLVAAGELDKALHWYIKLGSAFNDAQYVYGKAWVHWQAGEFAEALKDGAYLLELQPSKLILARTHYLMGSIQLHTANLEDADRSLNASATLYQELGKNGGLYLTHVAMATLQFKLGHTEDSLLLLDKALGFNAAINYHYPAGDIHEVRAQIFARKKDFDQAIAEMKFAEASYDNAGDYENALYCKISRGLYLAILGRTEEAHAIGSAVDEVVYDKQLRRLIHYNNLIWMFLHHCRGLEYAQMRNQFVEWCASTKDSHEMMEWLTYIEQFNCRR